MSLKINDDFLHFIYLFIISFFNMISQNSKNIENDLGKYVKLIFSYPIPKSKLLKQISFTYYLYKEHILTPAEDSILNTLNNITNKFLNDIHIINITAHHIYFNHKIKKLINKPKKLNKEEHQSIIYCFREINSYDRFNQFIGLAFLISTSHIYYKNEIKKAFTKYFDTIINKLEKFSNISADFHVINKHYLQKLQPLSNEIKQMNKVF